MTTVLLLIFCIFNAVFGYASGNDDMLIVSHVYLAAALLSWRRP